MFIANHNASRNNQCNTYVLLHTHLSQNGVEDIKMRVEIDAIGRLKALGLVAFLLLHEYVQLYNDISHTLCDFSVMQNVTMIIRSLAIRGLSSGKSWHSVQQSALIIQAGIAAGNL